MWLLKKDYGLERHLSYEGKMASETFQQRMERACRDKEIPGAIMVADDKEGMFGGFLRVWSLGLG